MAFILWISVDGQISTLNSNVIHLDFRDEQIGLNGKDKYFIFVYQKWQVRMVKFCSRISPTPFRYLQFQLKKIEKQTKALCHHFPDIWTGLPNDQCLSV